MFSIQTKTFGEKYDRVVFLLSGWGTGNSLYWLFAKILEINHFHVIVYSYDKNILSPDIKNTIKRFMYVKTHILHKINYLQNKGHREFFLFGTSLGTILAVLVANECPIVSKIILNLTGADIAETVWGWDQKINPEFKQYFQEKHITLSYLANRWKILNPINNLQNQKQHTFLVYLTKKDEIIPYSQGIKLLKEFDRKKIAYMLEVNNYLYHIPAATVNLFRYSLYVNFLNKYS